MCPDARSRHLQFIAGRCLSHAHRDLCAIPLSIVRAFQKTGSGLEVFEAFNSGVAIAVAPESFET
jgi:hypothetical protein